MWKSKTRVTSSNPRDRSSNSRVTSSNLRVTSSNPRDRTLKARVATLKARVGRLKGRVGRLKTRVRRLKARVEENIRVERENSELKILNFTSYEKFHCLANVSLPHTKVLKNLFHNMALKNLCDTTIIF